MEFLFELILDVFVSGLEETASGTKVPKPLRIAAAVLLILFFAAVIGLILFCGIMMIIGRESTDNSALAGALFIAIALLMLGLSIKKFVKMFKNRK